MLKRYLSGFRHYNRLLWKRDPIMFYALILSTLGMMLGLPFWTYMTVQRCIIADPTFVAETTWIFVALIIFVWLFCTTFYTAVVRKVLDHIEFHYELPDDEVRKHLQKCKDLLTSGKKIPEIKVFRLKGVSTDGMSSSMGGRWEWNAESQMFSCEPKLYRGNGPRTVYSCNFAYEFHKKMDLLDVLSEFEYVYIIRTFRDCIFENGQKQLFPNAERRVQLFQVRRLPYDDQFVLQHLETVSIENIK